MNKLIKIAGHYDDAKKLFLKLQHKNYKDDGDKVYSIGWQSGPAGKQGWAVFEIKQEEK